jgi:hypothetical protein
LKTSIVGAGPPSVIPGFDPFRFRGARGARGEVIVEVLLRLAFSIRVKKE